jgi:hypothetical protein
VATTTNNNTSQQTEPKKITFAQAAKQQHQQPPTTPPIATAAASYPPFTPTVYSQRHLQLSPSALQNDEHYKKLAWHQEPGRADANLNWRRSAGPSDGAASAAAGGGGSNGHRAQLDHRRVGVGGGAGAVSAANVTPVSSQLNPDAPEFNPAKKLCGSTEVTNTATNATTINAVTSIWSPRAAAASFFSDYNAKGNNKLFL